MLCHRAFPVHHKIAHRIVRQFIFRLAKSRRATGNDECSTTSFNHIETVVSRCNQRSHKRGAGRDPEGTPTCEAPAWLRWRMPRLNLTRQTRAIGTISLHRGQWAGGLGQPGAERGAQGKIPKFPSHSRDEHRVPRSWIFDEHSAGRPYQSGGGPSGATWTRPRTFRKFNGHPSRAEGRRA